MTLRLTCRWAGAAIAAFDTVVVRKPRVRFSVCEASSGVHEKRARLTLANCRGDTGIPVLPACRMGECDGIEKFPETLPRSGCVWRVAAQYYRELR